MSQEAVTTKEVRQVTEEQYPGTHSETIKYANRILAGGKPEDVLQGLPGPSIKTVQSFLAFLEEEKNKTEAIADLEGLSVDELIELIPTRFRSLPPDAVEDIWTGTVMVGEGLAYFPRRKQYILQRIREERGGGPIEIAAKGAVEAPAAVSEAQISPEKSKEVPLNKKIELDPNLERKSKLEVFGDSNGSYEGFVAHLESRGLAHLESNGNLTWTGGDTRVIFLGDILGDREADGEEIYNKLKNLNEQAEAAGGEVQWVAGNHDNMFNSVLFGFDTEYGETVEDDMNKRLTDYVGNLEMAKYLPEVNIKNYFEDEDVVGVVTKLLNGTSEVQKRINKRKNVLSVLSKNPNAKPEDITSYSLLISKQETKLKNFVDTYNDGSKLYEDKVAALIGLGDSLEDNVRVKLGQLILQNREEVLDNVRNKNLSLIEGICNQKLVIIEDDVLNCHTNFTKNMFRIIESCIPQGKEFKDGVDRLNTIYQGILGWYASPKPRTPVSLRDNQIEFFNSIRNEFISTSHESRFNYDDNKSLNTEEEKNEIRTKLKNYGINIILHGHTEEEGKVKGSDVLPILSLDRSAFKEGFNKKPIAVASVSKGGTLSFY